MQFSLKNRLRLISLIPILILFSMTSYYVYDSYINYKTAEELHTKLEQNKYLNDVVGNIARERGMSAMYLGNNSGNILKSLNNQRTEVDKRVKTYLAFSKKDNNLHTHNDSSNKGPCIACEDSKSVESLYNKIKETRSLVDNSSIEFDEMFLTVYTSTQKEILRQLETITQDKVDKEISELYTLYIKMARAKEFSGVERGYMSYVISRNTELNEEDLNKWIGIIGKADAFGYGRLHNPDLVNQLDALFNNEESKELFEDINVERTAIISAAESGEYDITSGIWFTMLSEKINLISDAESILLKSMDDRAKKVQEDSLQILIVTVTIWIVAILLGVLGYLLSNEIALNIKNLEGVLKKVAQDTDSDTDIDLHTSEGTNKAYELLEEIIEQTKQDKLSAQEASEAKSMFLANMSHEIRTPLNGIVGFTELLKDSGLEDEQKEFVDIIEKSSENLLEIINNILDLSKIESNKLEIEDIAFNPIVEFESAVEVYAVRAAEKHINLGCFIDPQLEFPLKGDPTKIKEVVINLLSNAVKFTNNAGAINVDIRKIHCDEIGKTRIKFEIQDSGIGVTSEQKSRIFEAFSQADTSITRKYGGTGLGLTISSNFIELMGGQLDLDSVVGEGTTFFFTIELEEVETLNESAEGSFNTLNALILSDSVKLKKQDKYLREYLDFFGVGYTTFKDVSKIELLQEDTNYNIIIADYDYVDEDTLEEISKLSQELIVLTKSNLMRKIEARGLDIFKTLYEPLHSSKLKTTLDNYSHSNSTTSVPKKAPRKKFDSDSQKFIADVLIAEDNIINQKLIKRTLEDLGLNITIANNGLEAFQKRKDGKFDMIFMDIQMPFLDGVEATQEILEWEEDYGQIHIPIVALTANALKGDREKFLSAGLDEYTTKPLVRSEIVYLLNQFLSEFIVENKDKPSIASEIFKEEVQEEAPSIEYKANILLAKKSSFENKLYTRVFDSIGKLSYEIANDIESFEKALEENNYKILMLDKEFKEIALKCIDTNNTKIILIDNKLQKTSSAQKQNVSKIIKNSINKEQMRTLCKQLD